MKERNITIQQLELTTSLSSETIRKLTKDPYYIPRSQYVYEKLFLVFNFCEKDAKAFLTIYTNESIKEFYKHHFQKARKEINDDFEICRENNYDKSKTTNRREKVKILLSSNPHLSVREIAERIINMNNGENWSEKTIYRDIKDLGYVNMGSRRQPKWMK